MSEGHVPRLLIVDDEQANLRALCDTLTMQDYRVVGCDNAAQALALLREEPFDLLLSDLHMPGMDGIALIREALVVDPLLVAIIMTGEGTIGTAVQAMQAGALDYVLKPFRLAAVMPVLVRALKMSALRRENAALEQRVRQQMHELQMANRDLEAFASSVSHDLRAPLHVVDGFSRMLLTHHAAQLDDKGAHYVERIRASVTQMSQLVEGLLHLSRLGRQALTCREVDIAALVAQVVSELRGQEVLTNHQVEVDAALPPAWADPLLLHQVLMNLLSNACKFSGRQPEPRVEVGFERDAAQPTYFVRDNGAGFDPAHAAHLFEPFQRLHKSEEYPGLGIGLSIVQRVVQRHGGDIRAESQPGHGACFRFTLPRPTMPRPL